LQRQVWRSPVCGLNRRRALGQLNESVAVQQPQQPGAIDAGEWPIAVAADQVEGSPAECRGMRGPAVEKEADIIHKAQPALGWHVAGRTVGIEPGEARSPGARDVASYWTIAARSSSASDQRVSDAAGALSVPCSKCSKRSKPASDEDFCTF